ncbi:extracellular solute-binding protein [Pseudophaeobacter arcticus]|uniref:extracellular solute-binding protein n=1 Tax=Pseudophaeobacter arcticus TaxID=385492 RepID=UPI00249331DF|nr:extracellular solute-binding protein [Pseudophaeobacter arcticus]
MKRTTTSTALAAGLALLAQSATAEGNLNLYNFGLYTPPELLEKFSKEYDVEVTLTDFVANEEAIARVQAGGHGMDVIIVSGYFIPAFVEQGLLMESSPSEMENFNNIAEQWKSIPTDPERSYTVPWVWGTTGVMVNTKVYDGDINTAAIFLDPPEELKGSINVVPSMNDMIDMTLSYIGAEPCTTDRESLSKARDLLLSAKENWASVDYPSFEKFINEDLNASVFWSGASARIHGMNDGFEYGWPATGYMKWMDNAAILSDATNVENARLFLNFIMAPENAAMISNYTMYSNGIEGSEEFMTPELVNARELSVPEELKGAAIEQRLCSREAQDLYTRIWTELTR